MMQETYPIQNQPARIKVSAVGNLRITGSDRVDILAEFGRSDKVQVNEMQGGLFINSQGDLDLEVPSLTEIEVDFAGGDAQVVNLRGVLKISQVRGDLEIRNAGTSSVDKVDGDLEIQHITGDLAVNHAGGDVEIEDISGAAALSKAGGDLEVKDVKGSLAINSVGGDLSINSIGQVSIGLVGGDLEGVDIRGSLVARRIGGDVDLDNLLGKLVVDTVGGELTLNGETAFRASIGGDAEIGIVKAFSGDASLNAGGDISLTLPTGIQARLEIASGGGRISMDSADEKYDFRSLVQNFTFGNGTSRIILRAGGDVQIISPDKAVTSGGKGQDLSYAGVSAFPGVGREDIEAKVLASTRLVAERIDAARERLEKRGIYIPGLTNNPPAPAVETTNEPVSEDERLIILRMLQDKKITIEEAERLLEALDAQDLTGEA